MYGAMCVYGQNKKDALWLIIQIYFLSFPPSSFFLREWYSRARWKSLGLVYGFWNINAQTKSLFLWGLVAAWCFENTSFPHCHQLGTRAVWLSLASSPSPGHSPAEERTKPFSSRESGPVHVSESKRHFLSHLSLCLGFSKNPRTWRLWDKCPGV